MDAGYLALLSILPIAVVAIFLVGLRWPASRAMPITYGVCAVLALFVWQVPTEVVAAATVNGVVIAVALIFIIFGAIFLLNTLQESGGLHTIRHGFTSISPDRRVQVIIVAWLFGSFIEGAAGFGAPSAVAVPLLVGLGFPAMAAVMSGMIIQSTPVSFGAAGTPVLVGVNNGLSNDIEVLNYISELGYSDMGSFLHSMGFKIASLHVVAGTLIPLLLVCMLTRLYGENRSFYEGLKIWKFALFSALAMTIPYLTVAYLLGPEFPSLLGGLTGLIIVVFAAKQGFLMPDQDWHFPEKKSWNPEWIGSIKIDETNIANRGVSLTKAWAPYGLVAILLVITRLDFLPFKSFMKDITIRVPNLFGTDISINVSPLYLPGTIFIVAALFTYFLHNMDKKSAGRALSKSAKIAIQSATALIFTVPMVQVFTNSGGGAAGFEKMPIVLADSVSELVGSAWPVFATFIGGIGAFVAGSNTVSNMMFSSFQFGVGERIGVDPTWIVALQAVGGAAGNMICVHNVVAASAVVGMLGREGMIIRQTIWPFVYYAAFTGVIGYWIVWSVGSTLHYVGFVTLALLLMVLLKKLLSVYQRSTIGFSEAVADLKPQSRDRK